MTSIEPSEQENSPDGSSGKTPAVAPPRGKPLSPEHTDISRLSSDLLSSGQLDMSQWVTLPHMQAVRPGKGSSLPSHPGDATDDDPLEASATWILPIITGQHPAAPSSGRLQAIISDTSARLQAVVPGAEGYIALLRNLAKSSGIYALAALASPLISLVLAPFLTRHLSPADYGLLAIMNTLIGLTAGVTQLGLSSAFFRAYSYDYSSREDRNSVLTTVAMILALITIPVAIIVSIYAPTIGALLFGRSSAGSYIALAAGVVLLQNMTVPGFAWLRAENRPLFFSLLAIGNLIIALTANIVFIGVFKLGITGSLLATGSGYAFIVLLTIPLILLRAGLRVRLDVAWNVLSFGTPMVMNFISFWVLQLSDRYLLSKFGSLEQTATYTVAYSLGSVLSTAVISPFSLAWPQTMFTVAKRRDAAKIFRLIFRWFSLFLLLAAFAFSLAGKLLLIWFFPPGYRSVAAITPLIAASIVFFGVYNVVMVGAGVRRKPWMGGVFATIAAVANLALNFVLIPRFGAIGAALSTLIAYVVLAVAGYLANQRIYPIPFEIGRFVLAALSGAAIYLGYYIATAGLPEKTALPIGIGGLIAYGILLFFIGQGGNLIGKIPGGVPQPAFIRRGLSRGVVAGGDLSRSVDPTPPPLSLQPEAPVRLARVRMGGRAELMAAVLVVGLVAGLAFVIHPTLASTTTAPPPVPPSNTTEPLGPILSGSSIGGTMAAFSQTYGSPVSAKASSAHYLVQLSGQKVGVDVTLTPGRDNQPHVIAIVLSLVSSDARWQPKNVDQLVSGFLPPDAQKLLDGNDRQDVYEQVYSSASLAGTLPDGAFSDDNLNPVTPGRFNVTCTGDVRGFTSCFVSPGQH